MKTVPPGELLEYRDGREGNVAPVRVERSPGGVRVVVRYPTGALARARARLVVATAVVAAFPLISLRLALWSQWFWILPGFCQLGVTLVVVLFTLWWRAGWVYVFETDLEGVAIETRGRLFNRRRECPRDHIRELRVHTNRLGCADAMEIKSANREVAGMWLAHMGDQYIRDATAAIREGLGMEPT